MQDWRFDDLTRTLGKATSRRQVFKGLAGGLVAAALARSGAGAESGCSVEQCKADADEKYHEEYQACKQDGGKGAGACTLYFLLQRYFNMRKCERTGCFDGTCCGSQCSNLYNDAQNCGACGHACPDGATCLGKTCQCPNDLTYCNDNCVDTDTDRDNCGACGNTCTGCQMCLGGDCVDSCGDNATCCNDQCVSTQCTAPQIFDPSQCSCVCPFGGQCGTTCCDSNQECCAGQCHDQCPPGQHMDQSSCTCICDTGETCGPFCCSGNKICCPDTLSGQSCRDPNGDCGCGVPCGGMCCGQYEFCCIDSHDQFHCVENSGDSC